MSARPLIILDRDGVINEDSSSFVKSADEWIAVPGSLEAIGKLSAAGWRVIVASNQSGLARGKFGYAELSAMHRKCQSALNTLGGRIDGWFFCPHGPDDGCVCRKPATGLYKQIARYTGQPLTGVPSVGDSMRDLIAAKAAGARPILVRTGNGRDTESTLDPSLGADVYADLARVVDALLS